MATRHSPDQLADDRAILAHVETRPRGQSPLAPLPTAYLRQILARRTESKTPSAFTSEIGLGRQILASAFTSRDRPLTTDEIDAVVRAILAELAS